MKKILFMTVTLCLLLSLTACSCGSCGKSSPPVVDGSYFLQDYKNYGVQADLYEEAKYSVKYQNNDVLGTNGIKPNATGTFTTVLTGSTVGDIEGGIIIGNSDPTVNASTPVYKFETTYELNGTYEFNNKTYTVADKTLSTVWFFGTNGGLRPLKAIKKVTCLTPFAEYKTNGEENISFLNYKFEYTVDYSTNDAILSFTDKSDEIVVPNGENSIVKEFDKQTLTVSKFNVHPFCENELLIFYPRAFALNADFSTTIHTVSVDGMASLNMKVNGFNYAYTFNYDKDTQTGGINGKTQTVNIDAIQYNVTGDYTGAPITVYCANVFDTNCLFKAPVIIEKYTTLVGYQQYTLTNYKRG